MYTNLQRLPQKRNNKYATWGSFGPICCNLESRPWILERRFAMNFAQKIRSPIGAPRSTKFGVLDLFICTGKEFKLHLLKSSHLGSLMNKPKWGPCSLIIAITLATASLVPATTRHPYTICGTTNGTPLRLRLWWLPTCAGLSKRRRAPQGPLAAHLSRMI